MVLPTGLTTFTPTEHTAYHNEIHTNMGWLQLPTSLTNSSSGHIAHHDAIHDFIGEGLPDVNAGNANHITHHNAIHARVNGIVNLTTANTIQTELDAAANGTIFVLAVGTYRPLAQTGFAPKTDQKLVGKNGAIINGAKLLTGWTAAGSDFWVTRPSGTVGSQPDDPGDGNRCAITGCENPHDVFYDGVPLVRVTSLGALATGKFFEDFAAGRTYIRDNPSGHTVEQAWNFYLVRSSNAGIRVRNFIAQFAANDSQTAAIEADGANWRIEQNDVRYNHGHAIGTNGNSSVVRRNKIHHQMQMGIGGEGDDVLVEYNEINHNNRDGSYANGWEAGGSKWALCDRLTLRGNWAHHNNGIGLWCDINLGNVIYEDNYVNNNTEWGIFYEIAYGVVTVGDGLKTHIRRNVSFDNNPTSTTGFYSGGQIVVSASRDCEVYENIVRGQDGIGGLAQLRTDHSDSRGSHQLHNLHVYNNDMQVVWDGSGFANLAGIQTDDANQTNGVYTSQGNTFENNRYYVPTTQSFWTWINDFESWAGWQALGNDDTGTRTVGGTVTIPSAPTLNAGPVTF
jgi:hypothetical protein